MSHKYYKSHKISSLKQIILSYLTIRLPTISDILFFSRAATEIYSAVYSSP